MKSFVYIFIIVFSFAVPLRAQQTKTPVSAHQVNQAKPNKTDSLKNNAADTVKQIAQAQVKHTTSVIKKHIGEMPDSTKRAQEKEQFKKKQEARSQEKISEMQYDSENPEAAPWKKEHLSKEDMADLPKALGADDKINTIHAEAFNNLPKEQDAQTAMEKTLAQKVQKSNYSKSLQKADSLNTLRKKVADTEALQSLKDVKKIPSEKYKRKLIDSLGLQKADSIFNAVSSLAKTTTPEQEMLKKINTPFSESDIKKMNGDLAKDSLMQNAGEWNGMVDELKAKDLSSFALKDSLLSELKPLSGRVLDSINISGLDSIRDVALKAKGMQVKEEQLSEEIKRASIQKKPKIWDKIYAEGVLGIVNDSVINIVQLSPAFAYRFAKRFSVGVGPNVLLRFQERKLNLMGGLRTFAKAEIINQHAYLQLENSHEPRSLNRESLNTSRSSLLAGGGGLLPISKGFALNLAAFYRVSGGSQAQTPWVFRIGISTIKK